MSWGAELHLPGLGVLAAAGCQRRRELQAEPPIVAQARVGTQRRQKQLGTGIQTPLGPLTLRWRASMASQVRLQRLHGSGRGGDTQKASRVQMCIMVMLYIVISL